MALVTNNSNKSFVFRKDIVLAPGAGQTVTFADAIYTSDARFRYNFNRMTTSTTDLTVTTPPPGYPDTSTDPPAETRKRLRPFAQANQVRRRIASP